MDIMRQSACLDVNPIMVDTSTSYTLPSHLTTIARGGGGGGGLLHKKKRE